VFEGIDQDRLWVDRAKAGDVEALNDLLRKHGERAYKFAYKLTCNRDEAADVVAEAFVRAFRGIDHFKGNCSFSTWLYRILTNCFLDQLKKTKKMAATSIDHPLAGCGDLPYGDLVDVKQSPDDYFEASDCVRQIATGLARLPNQSRTILILFCGNMLTYHEISERLGLPIGTVKSRLNRARMSMRAQLVDDRYPSDTASCRRVIPIDRSSRSA